MLRVWVSNLWRNQIIWNKMNWPWKVDNVAHARLPELLILSTCFSLLIVLVILSNLLVIVRIVEWHTLRKILKSLLIISLRSIGQRSRSQDHHQGYTGSTNMNIKLGMLISMIEKRWKSRSLPHWYLFIDWFFTRANCVN